MDRGWYGFYTTLGLAWGSSLGVIAGILVLPSLGLPRAAGVALGVVAGAGLGFALGHRLGQRRRG